MEPTERIELGEGQWWEIHTRLTRGMEKAITKASMASMPAVDLRNSPNNEEIKSQLLRRMPQIDVGTVEDVYLLRGTVAYSFGPTVQIEVIDGLDSALVRRVLERMFDLYNPQRVTTEQHDDFFVAQSNHS